MAKMYLSKLNDFRVLINFKCSNKNFDSGDRSLEAAYQVQPYKEIISRLSSWYEDLQVHIAVVFAST
jgi:hypothetical protein